MAYFKDKYNFVVRQPHLQCVILESKAFVPMEVCTVLPGTPIPPQRLLPAQTQDIIREAAQRPGDRFRRISEIRRSLAYETSDRIKSWGVDISQQPVAVQGRVLQPPDIKYGGGGRPVQARNGSWNLAGQKFCQSGRELSTWAVVNFSNVAEQVIQAFVSQQVMALRQLGVRVVNDRPVIRTGVRDLGRIQSTMNEAGRAAYNQAKAKGGQPKPPQLFLCIMDMQDQEFYEEIKRVAALHLASPVPSQVVNTKKALNERGQAQYCANVSMKINIKLGGTNQIIEGERDLPKIGKNTMLIGADVTHGAPGTTMPSVAGSVATMDGNRARYSSQVRCQVNERGSAQEILVDAAGMFEGHLQSWAEANNKSLPANVIVFRDGISEGQYSHAVDAEIASFKAAADKTSRALGKPAYVPKLTYIVCGKRHHIRFQAANPNDIANDRSGNLPAGTVVDTNVVHPFGFDLYLQAHSGLVGTARPAHYVVLHDDNAFKSDELQRVFNSLSYSYSRATRSVSLAPPAMYAHFLCEKARILLKSDDESDVASSISDSAPTRTAISTIDTKKLMTQLSRNALLGKREYHLSPRFVNILTFASTRQSSVNPSGTCRPIPGLMSLLTR